MSITNSNVNESNTNRNRDNDVVPFWIESDILLGLKEGTSVAFSVTRPFKDATEEQVLRIFHSQEVRVSKSMKEGKIIVAITGQTETGKRFTFGYLNNFDHGIEEDTDEKGLSAAGYEIKGMLELLVPDNISQPMSTDEANDILASL